MRLVPALLLCLLALAQPAAARDKRIVGGTDAPAGSFGFVANIYIEPGFGCTGTLIAPGWVMTAGHCSTPTGTVGGSPLEFPPQAFTVTLGTVDAAGEGGEVHTVSAVHKHPDYLATNGPGYDVGLLELSEPSAITPVQIAAPQERDIWEPGDKMTIAGFGTTESGGDSPDTMQVAEVPIVTDADCATAYPPEPLPVNSLEFDPATMVCAGYPQGGTDTCQGDSGGPLLAPLAGGGYRLVGSTSYGQGCAEPDYPGVYARLPEGPNQEFVAGLVPEAYATPAPAPAAQPSGGGGGAEPVAAGGSAPAQPAPAPAADASCTGTAGLTLRVRKPRHGVLRRVSVTVDGRSVATKRGRKVKPFTVDLSRALPRAGTATVTVKTVTSRGKRRARTITYSGCART